MPYLLHVSNVYGSVQLQRTITIESIALDPKSNHHQLGISPFFIIDKFSVDFLFFFNFQIVIFQMFSFSTSFFVQVSTHYFLPFNGLKTLNHNSFGYHSVLHFLVIFFKYHSVFHFVVFLICFTLLSHFVIAHFPLSILLFGIFGFCHCTFVCNLHDFCSIFLWACLSSYFSDFDLVQVTWGACRVPALIQTCFLFLFLS